MMLEDYLKLKKAQGIADNTTANYAKVLNVLNKFKKLEEIDNKDILVDYINQLKLSESTKMSYIVIIKNFFKECGKADLVDWMKVRKLKETLKSDDILNPEDINELLEACNDYYDKALISFLYESGCRISEAQRLKWKDLQDTTEGIIVSVPTKKTSAGYRKMILPFSSQYLRNLQIYSYSKPDDFIFPLSYRTHAGRIQIIKEKAGIKKPFTAHKLRHAQATQLVKDGVQEAIIRKKLGWSASSPMIARYQHLNDDAVIDATLEVMGIDNGRKPKKPVNINQPAKLSITEATGRLFEIEEENVQLKKDMEGQKKEMYKKLSEMQKSMEYMLKKLPELANIKALDRYKKPYTDPEPPSLPSDLPPENYKNPDFDNIELKPLPAIEITYTPEEKKKINGASALQQQNDIKK